MSTESQPDKQLAHRKARKAALEQDIKTARRAVLVVNTRSRRGGRAFAEAKRRLVDAGLTLDAAYAVRHSERLPEIVRDLIALGHKFIVVGGGDGTLSSVVDEFAYADVVFGLLPLGTANSFARELAIPVALEGAVDVIASGKVADIDMLMINGDYFLNTATLGLAPAIAMSTPHLLKKVVGRLAYAITGAIKFITFRSFRVRIVEGERQRHFDALQLLIANGRFLGGVVVAQDANPESRRATIQIVHGPNRRNLVRSWWSVARGRRPDPAIVSEFCVGDAVIECEPRQYVSIDGEVAAQTPIHLAIAHEALNIMVPPGFDDSDDDSREAQI